MKLEQDIKDNFENLKLRPNQKAILIITNPGGEFKVMSNHANEATIKANLINTSKVF